MLAGIALPASLPETIIIIANGVDWEFRLGNASYRRRWVRVFDSNAILFCLDEKTGSFLPPVGDREDLLS